VTFKILIIMVKQDKVKGEKKTRAKLSVLISPPVGLKMDHEFSVQIDGERIVCPWELRLAVPQLTDEEREKSRRIYRKEYMRRPETVAAVKERMSNPETVKKVWASSFLITRG
jgi:hypothetical protein